LEFLHQGLAGSAAGTGHEHRCYDSNCPGFGSAASSALKTKELAKLKIASKSWLPWAWRNATRYPLMRFRLEKTRSLLMKVGLPPKKVFD
jgi:hypothetical protein